MRIIDVIKQLLPTIVASSSIETSITEESNALASLPACPVWPPDVFAVVGTLIDRSGCYTQFSPDRNDLPKHEQYLDTVKSIVDSWNSLDRVPDAIQLVWDRLVEKHAEVSLDKIQDKKEVLDDLLLLFAVADEASQGIGWGGTKDRTLSEFATRVLVNAVSNPAQYPKLRLPHWPTSLCLTVPPSQVIVLPKSITTDKGCTIRSLSHNLALLPCRTMLDPEWRLVTSRAENVDDSEDLRLLLIPFPYVIPKNSFRLTSPRQPLKNKTTHAAYFGLNQNWLKTDSKTYLSGKDLANTLIIPLIKEATANASGKLPHGVVLPECALDVQTTIEVAKALESSGIQFLITGVLEYDEESKKSFNQAYTFFMLEQGAIIARPQNKHHRWRIDQNQADSYGLNFDRDPDNHQWWEDIDVSKRGLPFYAFRDDTSLVTLICEDLARMEPAMNAIRAVGPNLVVALLMDGPQLGSRWPGRYAGVLADEPGCSVLSLTCAATVDLSNAHFKMTHTPPTDPKRIIGRWTQSRDAVAKDIELPDSANGVLLNLKSDTKHQTTLDNRSDQNRSRELLFVSQIPLVAGQRPSQPT